MATNYIEQFRKRHPNYKFRGAEQEYIDELNARLEEMAKQSQKQQANDSGFLEGFASGLTGVYSGLTGITQAATGDYSGQQHNVGAFDIFGLGDPTEFTTAKQEMSDAQKGFAKIEQQLAPTRNWTAEEIADNPWEYITDPNGLRYNLGNMAGYAVGTMPLGGVGGLATRGLMRLGAKAGGGALVDTLLGRGLNTASKALNTKVGLGAMTGAGSGVGEAVVEGGLTYRDLIEQGMSPEEAAAKAGEVTMKNIPTSALAGATMGGTWGRAAERLSSPTTGSRLLNAGKAFALGAPMAAVPDAIQEAVQEGISGQAKGEKVFDIYSPETWNNPLSEEQKSAALQAFIGASLMGGIPSAGSGLASRPSKRENNDPVEVAEEPSIPNGEGTTWTVKDGADFTDVDPRARSVANIIADLYHNETGDTLIITEGKSDSGIHVPGGHDSGMKFDFAVNDDSKLTPEVMKKIEDKLDELGVTWINEYTNPSANSTGGHFDVSVRDVDASNWGITNEDTDTQSDVSIDDYYVDDDDVAKGTLEFAREMLDRGEDYAFLSSAINRNDMQSIIDKYGKEEIQKWADTNAMTDEKTTKKFEKSKEANIKKLLGKGEITINTRNKDLLPFYRGSEVFKGGKIEKVENGWKYTAPKDFLERDVVKDVAKRENITAMPNQQAQQTQEESQQPQQEQADREQQEVIVQPPQQQQEQFESKEGNNKETQAMQSKQDAQAVQDESIQKQNNQSAMNSFEGVPQQRQQPADKAPQPLQQNVASVPNYQLAGNENVLANEMTKGAKQSAETETQSDQNNSTENQNADTESEQIAKPKTENSEEVKENFASTKENFASAKEKTEESVEKNTPNDVAEMILDEKKIKSPESLNETLEKNTAKEQDEISDLKKNHSKEMKSVYEEAVKKRKYMLAKYTKMLQNRAERKGKDSVSIALQLGLRKLQQEYTGKELHTKWVEECANVAKDLLTRDKLYKDGDRTIIGEKARREYKELEDIIYGYRYAQNEEGQSNKLQGKDQEDIDSTRADIPRETSSAENQQRPDRSVEREDRSTPGEKTTGEGSQKGKRLKPAKRETEKLHYTFSIDKGSKTIAELRDTVPSHGVVRKDGLIQVEPNKDKYEVYYKGSLQKADYDKLLGMGFSLEKVASGEKGFNKELADKGTLVDTADKRLVDAFAYIKANYKLSDIFPGTEYEKLRKGFWNKDNRTPHTFAKLYNAAVKMGITLPKEYQQLAKDCLVNRKFSAGLDVETMGIKVVPREKMSDTQKKLQEVIRDSFGTTVIFFENDNPNFNGFYRNGEIYVNVKSKKTDEWIVSHELTHHLFQHEPNVFKAILDEMEAQNPITNEQIEKYRKRIHNGDKLSRADIVEEMVADAMFDVVKQTNLLKGIATKNPTMAERIIEVLNSIVQKLKDLVYTPLGLSARQGKALENAVFRLAGELKDGNGNRLFSKKGGYLSSVRTNLALDDNIVTDTVEDKDGNVAYVNNIMDNLFGKIEKRVEDKTKGETAEERLARDEEAFGKLVDTYIASDKTEWKEKKNGALFRVMDMPLVLQMLGAPDMTLSIYGSGFEHILSTQRHPGMHESILKQLPSQLADPIMVIDNNGKYVAVIELKDNNGATIVVPVEINKKDDQHGVISVVNTMYGRSSNGIPTYGWFKFHLKNKSVLYANKKKSTRWVQAIRVHFPMGLTLLNSALSDSSIKHESDLVKLKNEFPTKYSLFKTKNKSNLRKRKQLELLLSVNPMIDDYHVGIRSVGDIVDVDKAFGTDFEELYPDFTKDMAQEAQKTGKIKVYSSKPIKVGGFVSPSRMCAKDYAGNGKIYSKDVAIEDVAWIDSSEGEYAPVDTAVEQPIKYSLFKDSSENVPHSTRLRKIIEKGTGVKIAWGHTKDNVNVYYDDEQGVIRSRDANNFRVVMPKVAEVYCSLLDVGIQKVGDKRILDPAMRNYVTDYLMTGAGNRANTKEAKAFESAMKKNIEIAENIVELRAEFERYNQMSDAEKAMEAIKYDTRKPITAKRFKKGMKKLAAKFVDEKMPIYDLSVRLSKKLAESGQRLKESIDPYIQSRLAAGANLRASRLIMLSKKRLSNKASENLAYVKQEVEATRKMLRMEYPSVPSALIDKFKPLELILREAGAEKGSDAYKKFTAYLVAKRMLGIHNRREQEWNEKIAELQEENPTWSMDKIEKRAEKELREERHEKRELPQDLDGTSIEDDSTESWDFAFPPEYNTKEKCQKIIKELDTKEFAKAAQDIYNFQDLMLEIRRDAGLLSARQIDRFKQRNEDYVPLHREIDEDEFTIGDSTKAQKGSSRTILAPLEIVGLDCGIAFTKAANNKAIMSVASGAKLLGDAHSVEAVDNNKPQSKNVVCYYMNGKRYYLECEEGLAAAMVSLNKPADTAWFLKKLAMVSHFSRDMLTAKNPQYGPVAFFRDAGDFFLYEVNNPIEFVKYIAKAFKHVILRDELFSEYSASGASQSVLSAMDREYFHTDIANLNESQRSKLKNFTDRLLKPLEASTEVFEQAVRVAAYEHRKDKTKAEELKALETQLRKEGKSDAEIQQALSTWGLQDATAEAVLEGAYHARDLLDFAVKGEYGARLNTWCWFANAIIQGTYKSFRALDYRDPRNKARVKAILWKMLGYTALQMIVTALGEDDDDIQGLSDADRYMYYHVPIGKDFILRVPKPDNAFTRALCYWWDIGNSKRSVPIGRTTMPIENMFPSIIPSMALPVIETMANYSFFYNSDIVPARLQNSALPEKEYDHTTSEAAKILGKTFGWSPKKIDYLGGKYLGFLGKAGGSIIDKAVADKDIFPMDKSNPIIRRFAVQDGRASVFVSDAYEKIAQQNELYKDWEERKKTNSAAKPDKGFDRGSYEKLKKQDKKLKELTKKIRENRNNTSISREEQKRKHLALTAERNKLAEEIVLGGK